MGHKQPMLAKLETCTSKRINFPPRFFSVADGHHTPASNVAKLHRPVREPACTVDIVPALADQSLLSGEKIAKDGYISICDGNEVNIYDGWTARIEVSEALVLRGWHCSQTKPWRVPLQEHITNLSNQTLIRDGPTGTKFLNSLYSLPSTTKILNHIEAFTQGPMTHPLEAINNVYEYELPSIEPEIRYLHGAAGFPPKYTWTKSIRKGNYPTWPLLTIRNVNKFFLKSEETQKGHMRNQRQGVRSTKKKAEISPLTGSSDSAAQIPKEDKEAPAIEEKKDIFIATYKPREMVFTNQTRKFPHASSRGNNYQMVVHEIEGDSTWVEATKNREEGEMILARWRALKRMQLQGITPRHQVLDNEISEAYKTKFELPT